MKNKNKIRVTKTDKHIQKAFMFFSIVLSSTNFTREPGNFYWIRVSSFLRIVKFLSHILGLASWFSRLLLLIWVFWSFAWLLNADLTFALPLITVYKKSGHNKKKIEKYRKVENLVCNKKKKVTVHSIRPPLALPTARTRDCQESAASRIAACGALSHSFCNNSFSFSKFAISEYLLRCPSTGSTHSSRERWDRES